jgi:5-methylcytosine-specific restriction endonuclease McrA
VHGYLASNSAMPADKELFDLLAQVTASVWEVLSSSPWLVGIFVLVVLRALTRSVRSVIHGGHRKDPLRRFSGPARAEIFARAGHRCEQYSWLFGRCSQTQGLQADHVHPHSRGGATAVQNGQALCGRHNTRKAANVPWNWQLARLARRRESYFPAGTPRHVMRHAVAPAADDWRLSSDVRIRGESADRQFS